MQAATLHDGNTDRVIGHEVFKVRIAKADEVVCPGNAAKAAGEFSQPVYVVEGYTDGEKAPTFRDTMLRHTLVRLYEPVDDLTIPGDPGYYVRKDKGDGSG